MDSPNGKRSRADNMVNAAIQSKKRKQSLHPPNKIHPAMDIDSVVNDHIPLSRMPPISSYSTSSTSSASPIRLKTSTTKSSASKEKSKVFGSSNDKKKETSIFSFFSPKYTHTHKFQKYTLEGFKNLGNTCYINATLQSLLRLRPFTAELSQPHLKHSALDASSLLKSLLSIANEVEGVHGVINPQKVKDSIGKYSSRFAGYSQQDAHEFLYGVFDKLDEEIEQLCREERKIRHQLQDNPEELKLLKEKICPVTKTFSYTVQHTITCTQCGNTSTVNELFRGFSLDIPPPDIKEKPPLQQLLVEFFSPSELEKSCECGNNTATVTHKLVTLPRVLILHLKRFKANIDARTYSKCFTEIKPDTLIDLESCCTAETAAPVPFNYTKSPLTKATPLKATTTSTTNTSKATDPYRFISNSPEDISSFEDEDLKTALERSTKEISHNDSQNDSELQRALELSKQEYEQHNNNHQQPQSPPSSFTDTSSISPSLSKDEEAQLKKALELSLREHSANTKYKYHIHSVVSHIGQSAVTGHYVCDVFDPISSKWKHFDDSLVNEETESAALKGQSLSYLLFYIHDNSWYKSSS